VKNEYAKHNILIFADESIHNAEDVHRFEVHHSDLQNRFVTHYSKLFPLNNNNNNNNNNNLQLL
jgi:hypothetical protein